MAQLYRDEPSFELHGGRVGGSGEGVGEQESERTQGA
jgi:hypothetical protein